ncbi:MAG: hypothetical protein ACYCQJ_03040 [Nitrososphaerales archaeon]
MSSLTVVLFSAFLTYDFEYLTFGFGCGLVLSLPFLFGCPKYEFYTDSIVVQETPLSPAYRIQYREIQYCRPIFGSSFIRNFLGESNPMSAYEFSAIELKPFFGKSVLTIRENPLLKGQSKNLYQFISQKIREKTNNKWDDNCSTNRAYSL